MKVRDRVSFGLLCELVHSWVSRLERPFRLLCHLWCFKHEIPWVHWRIGKIFKMDFMLKMCLKAERNDPRTHGSGPWVAPQGWRMLFLGRPQCPGGATRGPEVQPSGHHNLSEFAALVLPPSIGRCNLRTALFNMGVQHKYHCPKVWGWSRWYILSVLILFSDSSSGSCISEIIFPFFLTL